MQQRQILTFRLHSFFGVSSISFTVPCSAVSFPVNSLQVACNKLTNQKRFYCFNHKPIRADFLAQFPRALLAVRHAQKRRALGSRMSKDFSKMSNYGRRCSGKENHYFGLVCTASSQTSKLSPEGKGPQRSMRTSCHGLAGISVGQSGSAVGLSETDWQDRPALTIVSTWFTIPGHHTFSLTICLVRTISWCPSCALERVACQRALGMTFQEPCRMTP